MSHDRIGIPSVLEGWQDLPELALSVETINICEASCLKQSLSVEELILHVHVYQPCESDSFEEFSNDSGGRDDDDTMAASVCELPNKNWDGIWNSLIYADDIKLKMLDYIQATLLLSDANVDCQSPSLRLNRTDQLPQSISYRGIGLFYFTGLPEQERLLSVVPLPKNSPSDCHTGIRCPFVLGTQLIISVAIPMRAYSKLTPILFSQSGFRNLASLYNAYSIALTT